MNNRIVNDEHSNKTVVAQRTYSTASMNCLERNLTSFVIYISV